MLKTLLFAMATLLVIPSVGHAQGSDADAPRLSANGLLLPGSFTGTLPCADCEGISHHLDLWADGTYQMRREWLGRETAVARDELGIWAADPVEGTIVLFGASEQPLIWDVEGPEELRLRDIEGQRIESNLNYSVAREDAFAPVKLESLFMSGLFTYMADAARFKECLTGRSYPVAMEGEYLTLERTYLEAGLEAAAPLYVTIEGGILSRPAMEGPDRPHIVIGRLASTQAGTECAPARGAPALENTYWQVVTLQGEDVGAATTDREPYLVLRDAQEESARFSATIGCNQFVGSYAVTGERLTFGPAAATMMACLQPFNVLERRLAEVLAETRSQRREGDTLMLLDEEGAVLADLRAVYYR
ncbi:MAG: META domain-containing protein [Pseudomonadota bacterium]